METYYMYFPFLTCEVKRGAAALDNPEITNEDMKPNVPKYVEIVKRLVKSRVREEELGSQGVVGRFFS
jgi:hypothetical protein